MFDLMRLYQVIVWISSCFNNRICQLYIEQLTSKDPLSPADKHNVAEMCVAWDLPTVVNDTNRNWLAEKILHHSVSNILS